MASALRRLVPCLASVVLLAGCPDSHSAAGPDTGPGGTDAGPWLPDGWIGPADAPLPMLPDAPSRCPLGVFDALCTSTGNAAVPVGTPVDLEVFLGSIDGCYCGEEIDCTGSLASDGVLDLTASVCTDSLCDACLPRATGVCHLPALPEGTWPVRVNGVTSFELTASNVSPFLPIDTCTTVPRTGCGPTWPPVPMAVDSACVDTSRVGPSGGAPIPVEVVQNCGGCGPTPGPCVTTQVSPTEFLVTPQMIESSCDFDCPAICMEVRHTCWIPALDPGLYTVRVAGIDAPMGFEVGSPASPRTCVGLLTGGGG